MSILYRATNLIFLVVLVIALVILAVASTRGAERVAFLYLPGVSGDSDDPTHRSWIEILSCDWGNVPPPRGDFVGKSGERAGKLCFGEFSILKPLDRATPTLSKWCLENTALLEARVEMTAPRGGYQTVLLKKVRIKAVRPGEDPSTEVLTLCFSQVEYR